jgi:hypothetical protein
LWSYNSLKSADFCQSILPMSVGNPSLQAADEFSHYLALTFLPTPPQLLSLHIDIEKRKVRHLLSIFIPSSNPGIMAFSSNRQPVVPSTSAQPAAQPDLSLISELLETIERSPPGVEALKLLVEHYISCGWLDAARDTVSKLLSIDRNDGDAQLLHKLLLQEDKVVLAPAKPPKKKPRLKYAISDAEIEDINEGRSQLSKSYKALFSKAKVLHWEMNILQDLFQQRQKTDGSTTKFEATFESNKSAVEALAEGRLDTSQKAASKPGAARTIARQMEQDPTRALDIAIQDLTDIAQWLGSANGAGEIDNDSVREALAKRTKAVTSALPRELQPVASTAQMHIEHELLQRAYICSETMYGDPVSEIPRDRFWVSEDGYPWDMEELAQAITSNGGVMRNPLSRQLFTPSDVKAIVSHRLGKPLAALQLAQSELSKGVRVGITSS